MVSEPEEQRGLSAETIIQNCIDRGGQPMGIVLLEKIQGSTVEFSFVPHHTVKKSDRDGLAQAVCDAVARYYGAQVTGSECTRRIIQTQ